MNEAQEMSSPIIRPYRESDRDFVEASWLQSYLEGCVKYIFPQISRSDYYAGQRRLIRSLLSKPGIKLQIACSPHYDEAVIAWMLSEKKTVHFVYTKEAFRRMGIARTLLVAAGISDQDMTYSHVTKKARAILVRYPNTSFDPWMVIDELSSSASPVIRQNSSPDSAA